jgi:two-component system, LytTR family, sensor kinase
MVTRKNSKEQLFMASAVRAVIVLVPLLSLLMLGRLAADWIEVAQITGERPGPAAPRGFDWVQWEDVDGEIVATYVYPGGTAHQQGLVEGAVLIQLEFRQLFSADDVKRVVEGIPPGSVLTYDVFEPRPGDTRAPVSYDIPITRYPTFLYPLSQLLWQMALWGFGIAAFLHVLGLVIVAPLAGRTRRARRTTALFIAASAWVIGNLGRLLAVTAFGPPVEGLYSVAFYGLSLIALVGWVLFPALLLHVVVSDIRLLRARAGNLRYVLFLPSVVLGGLIVATIIGGAIGPLTLDNLIAPILFYVCCYVALASGLGMAAGATRGGRRDPHATEAVPAATAWSRAGSGVVCLIAMLAALVVVGVMPLPGDVSDATVGAVILLIQLLSLAPVGLVSIATLRHGRAETVISGAMGYLAVLCAVFFMVLVGLLLIEQRIEDAAGWTHAVLSSIYVVVLLVLVERGLHLVRRRGGRWLMTERQRARERLRQFGERMRFILDPQRLADATVAAVGQALDARSAVLFLRDPSSNGQSEDRWIRASFRPEPPYFTDIELRRIWHRIQMEGTVWARNAELDESDIPGEDRLLLTSFGAALAIPVAGGESDPEVLGLLVLGRKSRRRAVYNLEDVALLRALAGQLALAVERLVLIEREKALIRETAEAQLTALRAQINPHFLFNTLNTIASLIAESPDDAERVVERLARIFRYILQTGGRTFVPLKEEITLVQNYLAIERARFGSKLRIQHDWDPALMEIEVPAFALQTIVENAVKHGIERQRGGGSIRLSSRLAGETGLAEIEVADSGVGIPAIFTDATGDGMPSGDAEGAFFGVGLRNVADRLERLYGRRDLLRFRSGQETGTSVTITLPLVRETIL